jgi:hypothetical protein
VSVWEAVSILSGFEVFLIWLILKVYVGRI